MNSSVKLNDMDMMKEMVKELITKCNEQDEQCKKLEQRILELEKQLFDSAKDYNNIKIKLKNSQKVGHRFEYLLKYSIDEIEEQIYGWEDLSQMYDKLRELGSYCENEGLPFEQQKISEFLEHLDMLAEDGYHYDY